MPLGWITVFTVQSPLIQFTNICVMSFRITDNNQKKQALWAVLKKLPQPNYDNLRYLIKFLNELTNHQDVNKMTPANIAIVIAPNLLWCKPEGTAGDMGAGDGLTMTHMYSSVLDQLLSNCSYFFPEGKGDAELTCFRIYKFL